MAHGTGHVRIGHHIRVVALAALSAAAVGVTAYQIERVFEPRIQPMDDRSIPVLSPRGRAAHDRPMVATANRRSHRGRDRSDDVRHRDAGGDVPGDLARSIVRG